MQNQAVILNVMKDLPFNDSRWILEILRQAQNDEIKGFAKRSLKLVLVLTGLILLRN
ncbi:hypothetical protein [Fodinibius halophilus]|uniref:hypothetical protein n=1 Tax=Fodinibius halophilus TaxID=1736908 RepID=UPI00197ABC3F|nr:hypothetical protein [Fodinibius halophilus]